MSVVFLVYGWFGVLPIFETVILWLQGCLYTRAYRTVPKDKHIV